MLSTMSTFLEKMNTRKTMTRARNWRFWRGRRRVVGTIPAAVSAGRELPPRSTYCSTTNDDDDDVAVVQQRLQHPHDAVGCRIGFVPAANTNDQDKEEDPSTKKEITSSAVRRRFLCSSRSLKTAHLICSQKLPVSSLAQMVLYTILHTGCFPADGQARTEQANKTQASQLLLRAKRRRDIDGWMTCCWGIHFLFLFVGRRPRRCLRFLPLRMRL